jgi:hypothetical protein
LAVFSLGKYGVLTAASEVLEAVWICELVGQRIITPDIERNAFRVFFALSEVEAPRPRRTVLPFGDIGALFTERLAKLSTGSM